MRKSKTIVIDKDHLIGNEVEERVDERTTPRLSSMPAASPMPYESHD